MTACRLDEALCGTSSIMPQKKNPYALERVRALAGESVGWMASQLGLLKTPTTTDCDLVFASGLHGSYFEATDWCIELMRETLATLRIRREVMAERAGAYWSTASGLADALVQQGGIDFRRAHHVVGVLVRQASAAGLSPSAVRAADVDRAAMEVLGRPLGVADSVIHDALDPARFVATRTSAGSVGPAQVARLQRRAEEQGAALAEDVIALRRQLDVARARLDADVLAMIQGTGR